MNDETLNQIAAQLDMLHKEVILNMNHCLFPNGRNEAVQNLDQTIHNLTFQQPVVNRRLRCAPETFMLDH